MDARNAPHLPGLARHGLLAALLSIVCAAALMLSAAGASAHTRGLCSHASTPVAHAAHSELQHSVICLAVRRRPAHHPRLIASRGPMAAHAQLIVRHWTARRPTHHGAAIPPVLAENATGVVHRALNGVGRVHHRWVA